MDPLWLSSLRLSNAARKTPALGSLTSASCTVHAACPCAGTPTHAAREAEIKRCRTSIGYICIILGREEGCKLVRADLGLEQNFVISLDCGSTDN